jgi:single-strand DNA-binding protein
LVLVASPGVHNAKERKQSHSCRNVGKDPDVKYSRSGTPIAKFSLATNERFKDRNDEWQERTEWHNIVAWQRVAEIVGEYVAKGSKLYVEGKIQTSSWEHTKSGERKYRTEIVARDLLLLGPLEHGGGDQQNPTSNDNEDQRLQSGSGESGDENIPF